MIGAQAIGAWLAPDGLREPAELIFTGGDWPARSARRQQLPRRAKLSHPLGSSFIREENVALDFSGRHAKADPIRFILVKDDMAAF